MRSLAGWFFLWFGIGIGGLLALTVIRNASYYLLPAGDRSSHPLHETLRSSGRVGLLMGLVGTALIFTNLLYLVRKHRPSWGILGSLRSWMAFHIFTGTLGFLFIVVHTAFLPRSPLGMLAFYSLCVVIVTGLMGRYIYARVPRSIEGRELEVDELRQALEQHRAELTSLGLKDQGFAAAPTGAAAGAVPGAKARRGIPVTLWTLLMGDPKLRRQRSVARVVALSLPGPVERRRKVLRLIDRLYVEMSWIARYQDLRALMSYWRFLHRWLALVLILLALFHIGIAVRYGALWVFGGAS